jgi:hypothetical protein
MGDMSKVEYITDEWVEDLKWREEQTRLDAKILTAKADAIRDVRMDYQARLAEHRKWAKADE